MKRLLISLLLCSMTNTQYLFERFPQLDRKINYISFCSLPTPIERLEQFGEYVHLDNLYIKRDDLTGAKVDNLQLYGGNKPRKLEFLLADALAQGAKSVVTQGCIGSNHALATAVYAHQLGFEATLVLQPQPNSSVVRQNLLLDHYYGAQLKFVENRAQRIQVAQQIEHDEHAYFIPTGGSNTIGAVGFINAALELVAQIEQGAMPVPNKIYVATGSCGTVAGLLLGLQVAQLPTKIIAVCVEPEDQPGEFLTKVQELFKATNARLHNLDAPFPLCEFPEDKLILNHNLCGTEYGAAMPETSEAIKIFAQTQGIQLEGTYSAKVIAALMQDISSGALAHETILFWNTYCGLDYSTITKAQNYKQLPAELHKYFEEI